MASQADRGCGVLAYGDIKRVELAIALANRPKLLLMDEPTAGMAPKERIELMQLTAEIVRERQVAVLFTEHDMDIVFGQADQIVVLDRGTIIARGAPGRGPRQPASARSLSWLRKDVSLMPDPFLRIAGLDTFYGRAHILRNMSFDVHRRQVRALLGRNGAGKSTTLKAIIGLVAAAGGEIVFDGLPVTNLPSYKISRRGIGYVPEERRIFSDLTVMENLQVGLQPPRQGVPHWTVERVLEIFPNLANMRNRLGSQMSGGEQQMLAIARTLVGNPALLLLDEPSEGLAPRIVEQMAEAIRVVGAEGLTIVLSEQNLHFASLIATDVTIIEKGMVRFSGTMSELSQNEDIQREYLSA